MLSFLHLYQSIHLKNFLRWGACGAKSFTSGHIHYVYLHVLYIVTCLGKAIWMHCLYLPKIAVYGTCDRDGQIFKLKTNSCSDVCSSVVYQMIWHTLKQEDILLYFFIHNCSTILFTIVVFLCWFRRSDFILHLISASSEDILERCQNI